MTHQGLVFNLLSDELVLTEGITCLSSDGIYGSLLHLLFDGTEQHEERLASTLLCFGRNPGIRVKGGRRENKTQERSEGKETDVYSSTQTVRLGNWSMMYQT